jgi:uncharacterized membrane protein YdbT with pleckstrin-like domain
MFRPAAATVILLAALIVAGPVLAIAAPVVLGVAALVALAIVWLIARWTRWSTTHFVVTSERLIHRSGVIAKQGMEVPLDRVHNIAFSQSAFERLTGSGDLLIESGGESGQQHFKDIPRPSRVQQEIYRAMEDLEDSDAARMRTGGELSVVEQVERLHALVERGAISQAEYEQQKARLLDRP